MERQNTFLKKVWERKSRYASVFISVAVSFLFVFLSVYGASTISSNITTAGTLTVSSLSTLTGIITTASSTAVSTLSVTGALFASSTARIDGLSTLAGFVSTASSTAVSTLRANDELRASSTLQATGNVTLYATTTVNVASSTPAQELSVDGDGYFHAQNGTTSVMVGTTGAGVGSCIQLRGTDGNWYRIYATTAASYVFFESGTCLEK